MADAKDQKTTRTIDAPGTAESLLLRVPGLVILCHPDPRRVGEEASLIKLVSGQLVGLSRG